MRAKLDVFDDMSRFTCAYCGTEMMVERRGGDVSLHGLADMLREVQAGSEKTAAEMALVRYTKELAALREEQAAHAKFASARSGKFAIIGIGGLVLGFLFLINGSLLGLVACALAAVLFKMAWDAAGQKSDP